MKKRTSIPRNGYDLVNDQQLAGYYGQKAFEWSYANKSLSDPELWNDLSKIYEAGIGVDQNSALAFYWLCEGANHGHAKTQCDLGDAYRFGIGVIENMEQAVYWYGKSAHQEYANAQYWLGYCYYFGEGVATNEVKAVEWVKKAAERGSVSSYYFLGVMYEECEEAGGKQDETRLKRSNEQAIFWWRKAAKQGYRNAISALKGLGVDWNAK